MDPIPGILDEQFFTTATPECLEALAPLVDDAIALRLKAYTQSVPTSIPAAQRIRQYLSEATHSTTFHLELLERGSCRVVEQLQLETLPSSRINRDATIAELQYLHDNLQYVRAYIEPRTKKDYETFYNLLPPSYKAKVAANKVMFYQPHARPRPTGVGIISRQKDTWDIALKGLKYRKAMSAKGYTMNGYTIKEF